VRWLKRWDVWSGIFGVIGVIIALYTIIEARKIGRISYLAETQKVFDPSNLSNFTLIDANKSPVNGPVYATNIVIWNSGDISLGAQSDRIREPLKITINGAIQYFIVDRINLVDQTNFQINISADKSSLLVSWKFFDPSQGIRITLLHLDHGDPALTVTGRFFEASIEKQNALDITPIHVRKLAPAFAASGIVIVVLGIAFWILSKLRIFSRTKLVDTTQIRLVLSAIIIVEGIMILGAGGFLAYFRIQPPI
jgi:hypothetical protein